MRPRKIGITEGNDHSSPPIPETSRDFSMTELPMQPEILISPKTQTFGGQEHDIAAPDVTVGEPKLTEQPGNSATPRRNPPRTRRLPARYND